MPKATRSTSKTAKARKAQPAAARTTRRAKPAAKKAGKTAKSKPARSAPKKKPAPAAEVEVPVAAVRPEPGEVDGLRAERDQLRAALPDAESRLSTLNRQTEELAALRAEAEATRRELESLRSRAADAEEVAEEAVDALVSEPPTYVLPAIVSLPPEERADDIRERLVHALNDAWSIEREEVGLLQTLADESGDREIRTLLEEHREAAQRQQAALEGRLVALGAQPSGGRSPLGQLVTRVWDAMQKPRDQADAAVQALLKVLSAAECEAGAYVAAHAFASAAGDDDTAELAARHYEQERARSDQLRAAIPRAVERAARR